MWISRSEYERLKKNNEIFVKKISEPIEVPCWEVYFKEDDGIIPHTITGFINSYSEWVFFVDEKNEELARFKTELITRVKKV